MQVKLCEVTQELDKMPKNLETVLKNKTGIRDYAYIIHDKDDTRPHVHIAIRLKDSTNTKHIAEWFGVTENFVEKVKGRWSDMLKYLTHRNAPSKFQYDDDEVVSNFDWKEERNKDGDGRKEQIINGIVNGEIREYNYYEHISAMENDKYNRSIDLAYKYRADMLMARKDREMEVVYLEGESGTGKTTYAKQVAEDKGLSYFVSSSSNDVLFGYKGEDCIILDDMRPSTMGLSDLLKMLDNNTMSTVKSRYRNKVLECKLIIITSVLPMDTFYNGVFQNENEPVEQFKRRCKTYITFDDERLKIRVYNKLTRAHELVGEMPNPVIMQYKTEQMTPQKALEFLGGVLGDVSKITLRLSEDGFVEEDEKNIPFEK